VPSISNLGELNVELATLASIHSFHHQVQPLVQLVQLFGIAYLRNSPIVYSYRHSITFLDRSGI
jgi:hypothetical protein